MTNFQFRSMLAVVTCFLMVVGCVVPGLAPASLPAPTADTVLLFTMVAETVAAANTATAAALAPASTSTPALPPPTEEVTATTAAEVSAAGSLLTPREDGTTLFADQGASYEVIVPAEWLAVRVNEQEYLDAWNLAEAADPAVQSMLRSIGIEDPNRLRLMALDTQDGHLQSGVVTTIRFDWDAQDDMSLVDEDDLTAVAQALPVEFSGLEVLTWELRRTTSGLPIGVITARTPTVTSDGNVLVLYQEKAYIDLPQGTLTITLSTTEGFVDVAVPAFDGMLETLSVIN